MAQTTLINDVYGVVGSQGEITDLNVDGKNMGLVRAVTSPGGGIGIPVGGTGLMLPATLRQQPNQSWPAERPAYDGPITLLGWDAPPAWAGGEYDQYIAIPRVHVPITETFGGYALGAVPDWTPTWGDNIAREISVIESPLSTDGRALRIYQSPGTTTYTVWDRARVEYDQSILARVLAPAVQTKTGNGVTLMLRATVAHLSAERHGYGLAIRCESTRMLRMVKWNAGTLATLAEIALPESVKSESAVVWMEFTVVGTALTGKLWFDGEDRSDAITVTATDATIAQGRQGIGSFLNEYANLVDYVAVSYNGQPAPGPGA